MKKNTFYALVWIGLLFVILVSMYIFLQPSQYKRQVTTKSGEHVTVSSDPNIVATQLTDMGWSMVGSEKCGACRKQKDFFGPAFLKINYIDYEQNPELCEPLGNIAIPYWIQDKSQQGFSGCYSPLQLAKKVASMN